MVLVVCIDKYFKVYNKKTAVPNKIKSTYSTNKPSYINPKKGESD